MANEKIQDYVRRYRELDGDRGQWLTYWEDLARYGAPRRMGFVGERAQGDRRVSPQIYNPIGMQCVQTLSSALHGWVMNPATDWLGIRYEQDELNDPTGAPRKWTNHVARRIMAALQSPNTLFHTHANQVLEDMAGIGTACMYIGQQNKGPLFVRAHTIAEVVIAENQYGRVDTVMRDTKYTVKQVVDQWGDKVSKKTRELYDKSKYDVKIHVVHSVMPRMNIDDKQRAQLKMPWEVCYFETQAEHMLDEGGVEEFPYVIPRWWLATGEVYGRSPLMNALPQIKVANIAVKDIMDAAEKAVSPALTVPYQGVMSPVRTGANGITYLKGQTKIEQVPSSSQLPFASEWVQQINNEIRTTMFVDQVQFVGDFKMTATEVIQRQTERMRLLGPVLGRLEGEFLNPLVERVFGILRRNKAIDEPPEEIQGEPLRIEYQSPLSRAQKSQLAAGFQQYMAIIEPLLKAAPDAAGPLLAPIDFDHVTEELFDWLGVGDKLLKDPEAKAADEQKAQQANMLSKLPELAKAAQAGGAALKSGTEAGINAQTIQNGGVPAEQGAQPVAQAPPQIDLSKMMGVGNG